MSKLSDILEKNQIDTRRIIAASRNIEGHKDEDRRIRLAKERVREGRASDAEKQLAEKKKRSGRPVTEPTLARALRGDKIPSKAQERITRALNHLLAQKKKDKVSRTDLF
ncbi:MAG: hypothetical protein ACOCUS_06505 [Polyangiales bacterium]